MTRTFWMNTALATTALSALVLAGCATSGHPTAPAGAAAATPAAATSPTLWELAGGRPDLSTFARLARQAGLDTTLKAAGSYTVFAPTDEAFKAVPAKTLEALMADRAALRDVLSYHIVPATLPAHQIKPGTAKTLQGATVETGATAGIVTVGDAMVTQADLNGTNGVVHVVDRVLMPPKK